MKRQEVLKATIAPVALGLLMIGMILLLVFISTLIPWGMGRGCWAQC